MAEKEDFLIQEINEELNAERLRQLWERFGSWVVALCILLVLGTSGYVFWKNQRQDANETVTATLLSTNEAIDRKQYGTAASQLLALPDHAGSVALLARLKAANAFEQDGNAAKAKEQFEIVAGDKKEPALAGYAQLRLKNYEAENPSYAPLAKELHAIALYSEGKKKEARKLLKELLDDVSTPRTAHARAEELLAAFQ